MVQWLRIRLATQEIMTQSPAPEDPTCLGETNPVRCNSLAHGLEPLKPVCARALLPARGAYARQCKAALAHHS